ncbi:hypothetical protein AVEN_36304-1, partial [Araneus ventricosus]
HAVICMSTIVFTIS